DRGGDARRRGSRGRRRTRRGPTARRARAGTRDPRTAPGDPDPRTRGRQRGWRQAQRPQRATGLSVTELVDGARDRLALLLRERAVRPPRELKPLRHLELAVDDRLDAADAEEAERHERAQIDPAAGHAEHVAIELAETPRRELRDL